MNTTLVDHIQQNLLRFAVAAVLFLTLHGPSFGQETCGSKAVNGMIAYYAVVPSQFVGTHPPAHPEATMHGGVPSGKRSHHLIVALFEEERFERVTNADVSATVAEVGLAGRTKPLEPFTVNDALTYGNYFDFTLRTRYRITVSVRRPGKAETKFQFEYEHR